MKHRPSVFYAYHAYIAVQMLRMYKRNVPRQMTTLDGIKHMHDYRIGKLMQGY